MKKFKEGMGAHLLPGESITVTAGGRSTTVAKGAEEAEVEI